MTTLTAKAKIRTGTGATDSVEIRRFQLDRSAGTEALHLKVKYLKHDGGWRKSSMRALVWGEERKN